MIHRCINLKFKYLYGLYNFPKIFYISLTEPNKWRIFWAENPTPTQKEVYQFGGRLIDEFKLNDYIMTQYK
jgi:hypothetical protein